MAPQKEGDRMELWIVWILLGGLIGMLIYPRRGGHMLAGLVGGALLGPVLVWLMFLITPQARCPECAEKIKRDARRCKHCGATVAAH